MDETKKISSCQTNQVPFLKSGFFEIGLTKNNEKHYDTWATDAKGRIVTGVGLFSIESQVVSGRTMAFAPDIIETPSTSYLENGDLRKPRENFEGLKMQYGYGAHFPVKNLQLTLAGGYSNYNSRTPDKQTGLDAKDININGYQVLLKGESENYGIGLTHQQQFSSYQIGFTGYNFFLNKDNTSENLNAFYKFNPDLIFKTEISRKDLNQKIDFEFTGMPPLFPAKISQAEQWTIKPGLKVNNLLGFESVEFGPIFQTGQIVPSIISVPVKPNLASAGAYLELTTKNQVRLNFTFLQVRGAGIDDYFNNHDLYEQISQKELTAGVSFKKFLFSFGYVHLDKGARFIKPTPVDFLIWQFPEGGLRTTTWIDDSFSLFFSYELNKHLTLTTRAEYSDAAYNQYGNIHDIPNKRAFGFSVKFSF